PRIACPMRSDDLLGQRARRRLQDERHPRERIGLHLRIRRLERSREGVHRQTHMTWKTLETASGPATRVPQQVKAILSGDAQKRAQGVHALLTTLVQSGRWFSASAPTTDLILRSVADAPPDAPGAGRALWLALDIATAINEDFLRGLHSWQTAPEADECR